MKVTDLDYDMEKKLVKKLDLMINRCKKKDVLLIIEGSEGEGKTNASEAVAYYIRYKTGRTINMFFRLEGMIEFAKSTDNQLIIWDEPALDSLSTDWYRARSKDLIRLLMVCRKKNHFFIFNFVKFFKFSEYIIVDRAHGFMHMYTRSNGQQGRFVYIRQKNLERLYNLYRVKKKRDYRVCKSFGGWIPFIEKHFTHMDITIEGKPHCTIRDYEALKDKGIESIGNKDYKQPTRMALQRNALFYWLNKELGYDQKVIAKKLGELTGKKYERNSVSVAITSFTRESQVSKVKI